MDFKEYSRQRDIAVKRVKRLQASGERLNVHIPTVKELRSMDAEKAGAMFHALQTYLEVGASLSRKRESERIHYTREEEAERKRQYQRDYRRRRIAEAEAREGQPNKYTGYLKGLKKLGVDLKPSQLPGFFQYMDYRFAQGNASRKYVFDIFVDDYKDLLQKGYKPDQIVTDYERFQADQTALEGRASGMSGYSVEDAISSWDRFVKK